MGVPGPVAASEEAGERVDRRLPKRDPMPMRGDPESDAEFDRPVPDRGFVSARSGPRFRVGLRPPPAPASMLGLSPMRKDAHAPGLVAVPSPLERRSQAEESVSMPHFGARDSPIRGRTSGRRRAPLR